MILETPRKKKDLKNVVCSSFSVSCKESESLEFSCNSFHVVAKIAKTKEELEYQLLIKVTFDHSTLKKKKSFCFKTLITF